MEKYQCQIRFSFFFNQLCVLGPHHCANCMLLTKRPNVATRGQIWKLGYKGSVREFTSFSHFSFGLLSCLSVVYCVKNTVRNALSWRRTSLKEGISFTVSLGGIWSNYGRDFNNSQLPVTFTKFLNRAHACISQICFSHLQWFLFWQVLIKTEISWPMDTFSSDKL